MFLNYTPRTFVYVCIIICNKGTQQVAVYSISRSLVRTYIQVHTSNRLEKYSVWCCTVYTRIIRVLYYARERREISFEKLKFECSIENLIEHFSTNTANIRF